MDLFPNGNSHYLPFEGSDHRPILSAFDSKKKKPQRLFRYDRRLRDNEEVKELIDKIWREDAHLTVIQRITSCRQAISSWSRRNHTNSQKTIVELRKELDTAMSKTHADDLLISSINQKLLKAYKAEEEFWKQQSRQLWLTLSDRNTGFFHVSTKSRRARNRLTAIEDAEGNLVYEDHQITAVISDYFQNIFNSSSPSATEVVNRAITPCISTSTNETLTAIPSISEVKAALFGIHPDKASGPDGFSASFFPV